MAKYGIPYQGSKSGIADSIITFLPKGKRFCDLFGGGFAITECAMKSRKWESFLYNEINPLLVELIQKAISGEYSYDVFKPEWISREDFKRLKEKDGYVKWIWSFSNGCKNYLFSEQLEPLKRSIHNFVVFGIKDDFINRQFGDIDKYVVGSDIYKRRMLLRRYMQMKAKSRKHKDIQQLEQLEIKCGSYTDYEYRDGDIVYCDPPYEGTAKYSGGFDHKEFYEWVASRPYQVWFSSYQNISDKRFKMVWAKGKVNLMAGAANQKKNYECIYTNKHDKTVI